MKVLILAAGYALRLYPHTKNFPKSLLKIGKKPIINYLLDKVEELDNISRVIVVTNGRFFQQFHDWKKSLETKYPVCLLNDLTTSPKDKLGAIGDMYFAFSKERFTGDFLVLGGDNLFNDSLVNFMQFARRKYPSPAIGLFDIKDKQEACHYGVVSLNKRNRIIEFCEKPARPKTSLVATCLYYFPKEKLQLMKQYLSNPGNSRDTLGTYISWLSSKDKVYGFKFSNPWFDIGHIHTYKKVEKALKGKE
ncbi:MAG: nucleotidyltransferase family protein [Candidatus Omnitrophota bacterium]